jgi:hypothetical protein
MTIILVRLSTSYALTEFKIIDIVNEVVVDYMRHCCSHHNGDFNNDYTQLESPGTHTVSNSDSRNYSNEQELELRKEHWITK